MTTTPISVRVPDDNHSALTAIANDTGQTLSDVVNDAIARYLGRAGTANRTTTRLDRLEEQVNRLTLLLTAPQNTRAELAAQYLQMQSPYPHQ